MKKLLLLFVSFIFLNINLSFSQYKPLMTYNEEVFLLNNGLDFNYKWDNNEANYWLEKSIQKRNSGNKGLFVGIGLASLSGIISLANELNPNKDADTNTATFLFNSIFLSSAAISFITGLSLRIRADRLIFKSSLIIAKDNLKKR